MRTFWSCALLWAAGYLTCAPLPKSWQLPKLKLATKAFRRPKTIQISFAEQLQFLYCIKTQLLSGATQIAALEFALSRINETLLTDTRKSMLLQSGVPSAMKRDASKFKFSALGNYAVLMEASAISGASISQALSNLSLTMIRNRTQEQLVAAELASTRATVLVLAGLPIIGASLAMMLGAQSITWLLTTSAGRFCLLAGLVLELLGWQWIQKLLATALQDPA